MKEKQLVVSALPKTWIIDVDGVILKHNGYLDGSDELLPGALEFWEKIGPHDIVIITSARNESLRESTLKFLMGNGLRIDYAFFGLPVGERILINDSKPSGLPMGHVVNLVRDKGLAGIMVKQDPGL